MHNYIEKRINFLDNFRLHALNETSDVIKTRFKILSIEWHKNEQLISEVA